MEGLFRYYPKHPIRWGGGSLTSKGTDQIRILNQDIARDRHCREETFAHESRPTRPGVNVEVSLAPDAETAAVNRKYPPCSMRQVPPEPRLCVPLKREEFCRIERNWKDVQPVQWSASPDSPLKRKMLQAIVRAVARKLHQDPGRNQILVHDFNVDDKGTTGAIVDRNGYILQRIAVRLDKDDSCLAEVEVLMGAGCSPCTEEMLTLDAKTRSQMLLAYPEALNGNVN